MAVKTEGLCPSPEAPILAVPTDAALQVVSHTIVARPMTRLSRLGALIKEQASTSMADNDADSDDDRARRSPRPATDSTNDEFDRHERQLSGVEF